MIVQNFYSASSILENKYETQLGFCVTATKCKLLIAGATLLKLVSTWSELGQEQESSYWDHDVA